MWGSFPVRGLLAGQIGDRLWAGDHFPACRERLGKVSGLSLISEKIELASWTGSCAGKDESHCLEQNFN